MRILLTADVFSASGRGYDARSLASALLDLGHDVRVQIPPEALEIGRLAAPSLGPLAERLHGRLLEPTRADGRGFDLQVLSVRPGAWPALRLDTGCPAVGRIGLGGLAFLRSGFELGVPDRWLHAAAEASLSAVWLPTFRDTDLWARPSRDSVPARVVPVGPDVDLLESVSDWTRGEAVALELGVGPDTFCVLSVGPWTARSNLEGLIAAFVASFAGTPDLKVPAVLVLLVLVVSGDFCGPDDIRRVEALAAEAVRRTAGGERSRARVLLVPQQLAAEQLAGLCRRADVAAFAHRALPWGSWAVTCHAQGTPVILPRCVGPERVGSKSKSVPCAALDMPEPGWVWREPSTIDLARALAEARTCARTSSDVPPELSRLREERNAEVAAAVEVAVSGAVGAAVSEDG